MNQDLEIARSDAEGAELARQGAVEPALGLERAALEHGNLDDRILGAATGRHEDLLEHPGYEALVRAYEEAST